MMDTIAANWSCTLDFAVNTKRVNMTTGMRLIIKLPKRGISGYAVVIAPTIMINIVPGVKMEDVIMAVW
uniref:Uncharacterized protein n=1 Tax=Arion vulgaris TaxID=1028688 RepID=A0A0B6ZSS7_9EUPU